MKKVRYILILALAFSMLFAGSVLADDGLTSEDLDLIFENIHFYSDINENGDGTVSAVLYDCDKEKLSTAGIIVDSSASELRVKKADKEYVISFSNQENDADLPFDTGSDKHFYESATKYSTVFENNFINPCVKIESMDGDFKYVKEIDGIAKTILCDNEGGRQNHPYSLELFRTTKGNSLYNPEKITDTAMLKSKISIGQLEQIIINPDSSTPLDEMDFVYTYYFELDQSFADDTLNNYFLIDKGSLEGIENASFYSLEKDEINDLPPQLQKITHKIIQYNINPNSGSITLSAPETSADGKSYKLNCMPEGQTRIVYCMFLTAEDLIEEPVTFSYEGNFHEEKSTFEKIEEVLADFAVILGKTINATVSWALGRTLTLDDIIFNDYDEVKLDFFKYDSTGKLQDAEGLASSLIEPVNGMYNVFRGIAIIGYMSILVYIGTKILLSSTTAKKKATYKEMLSYWVTGILILFIFPYAMRIIIDLNNAFVAQIKDSRTENAKDVTTTEINQSTGEFDTPYLFPDVDAVVDYSNALGNDSGYDYMSRLGALAEETHKLGVSVAYLILCWQLVMMIIYYYKRVFMIAFLIMIFPLIAFMYVWDKLNDGKSQSFSAWTQEFTVSVFVQSFHAIVYVFVCNAIYETLAKGSTDFILLICAGTFMFVGEDILKQIFGAGGTVSAGSVTQSGAQIMVLTRATKRIVTSTIKNTIGKNGFTRQTIASFRNARKYGLLTRKGPDGRTGLDVLGQNHTMNTAVAPYLPKSGEVTDNIRTAAESAYILDNADKQNSKDVAKALGNLDRLRKIRNGEISGLSMTDLEKKQFDAIMDKCKYRPEQFEALNSAMVTAAIMKSGGETTKNVMQYLKLEVEYAFPEVDKDSGKKKVANKMLKAAIINMKENGVSQNLTGKDIEKDWETKVQRVNDFNDRTKFSGKRMTVQGDSRYEEAVNRRANQIFESLKKDVTDFDRMSMEEKDKLRQFSFSLANLRQVKDDGYDVEFYKNNLDVVTKDYGANQAVIENYITKHGVDVVGIRNTVKSSRKENVLQNRAEGLIKQYIGQYGEILTEDRAEFESLAREIVTIEQAELGVFSASNLHTAVTALDNNSEKVQALLRLSNLDMDIESLKVAIALKIQEERSAGRLTATDEQAIKWSNKVIKEAKDYRSVRTGESTPRDERRSDDPLTSIYDILAGTYNVDGTKNTTSELVDRAGKDEAKVREILDRKTEAARVQNRMELAASKAFAAEMLNPLSEFFDSDSENSVGDTMYAVSEKFKDLFREEPEPEGVNGEITYNGMTLDEIKRRQAMEFANGARGLVKMVTAIPAGVAGGMIGSAIGAANTKDAIPLEEGVGGMIAGLNAAESLVDGGVSKVTMDNFTSGQISEIESAVSERVKQYKKDDKEANKKIKDEQAEKPVINSLTGTLFRGDDGNLFVDINISAKYAATMSISERMMGGGSWLPYQDHIIHALDTDDERRVPDIFVRVKSPKGDIRVGRIRGLRL